MVFKITSQQQIEHWKKKKKKLSFTTGGLSAGPDDLGDVPSSSQFLYFWINSTVFFRELWNVLAPDTDVLKTFHLVRIASLN